MTTETNTPDEDVEFTSDQFVQLRDAHRDLKRKLKDAEARLTVVEPVYRATVLKDAGIDPDSPQAKAVLKLHGDGEFTAEALKATATDFGIPLGTVETAAQDQPLDDAAQRAIASADRNRELQAVGTPVEPQSAHAEYAAAEAAGDLDAMIRAQEKIAREWKQQRSA